MTQLVELYFTDGGTFMLVNMLLAVIGVGAWLGRKDGLW